MNRDFVELLTALSEERAEYLVVGGYAVAFHTEPRYTKDLDVWVRPTRANARRVMKALKRFGAPLRNLKLVDLATPGIIYQMGVEPNRIDIITEVEAVKFEEAWARRVAGKFGAAHVEWMAPIDLTTNKRAVGRPQDLRDVAMLEPLLAKPARTAGGQPRHRKKPRHGR